MRVAGNQYGQVQSAPDGRAQRQPSSWLMYPMQNVNSLELLTERERYPLSDLGWIDVIE